MGKESFAEMYNPWLSKSGLKEGVLSYKVNILIVYKNHSLLVDNKLSN